MCQRPKRAFIISTQRTVLIVSKVEMVCQRPKRAFIISTNKLYEGATAQGGVSTP